MKNKSKRTLAIWALVIAVGSLTVAYAVLQATLTISGTAVRKGNEWDVKINNFKYVSGEPVTIPTISGTNLTFSVNFKEPGDYSVVEFTVANEGTVDASLGSSARLEVGSAFANIASGAEMGGWSDWDTAPTSNGISCVISSNADIEDGSDNANFLCLKKETQIKAYLKCRYNDIDDSTDLDAQDSTISVRFHSYYIQHGPSSYNSCP